MLTPVTLKKTGRRAFMGGVFSSHKKIDINITHEGIVEACYDRELGNELLKIGQKYLWAESIGFIVGVNHLLLRKVGIGTKLQKTAGLTTANLDGQMQQLYDLYIPASADQQVNINSANRVNLLNNWHAIKSAQACGILMDARHDIVEMIRLDCLPRDVKKSIISPRLAKILSVNPSPTDVEVVKRLEAQGPTLIQHLGGRRLGWEETRAQYAALHGQ